jgi:hypothetical protein
MATDKTLGPRELEKLLDLWQRTYGEQRFQKNGIEYFHIEDKYTAFNALIQTLTDLGYDEEDINSSVLRNSILKIQTPYEWKKLNQWRIQVGRIWDGTINSLFPSKIKLKEAKVPDALEKPTVFLEKPLAVEIKKEKPAEPKEPDYLHMPDTVKRSDKIGEPVTSKRFDFDLLAELDKLDDEQ